MVVVITNRIVLWRRWQVRTGCSRVTVYILLLYTIGTYSILLGNRWRNLITIRFREQVTDVFTISLTAMPEEYNRKIFWWLNVTTVSDVRRHSLSIWQMLYTGMEHNRNHAVRMVTGITLWGWWQQSRSEDGDKGMQCSHLLTDERRE